MALNRDQRLRRLSRVAGISTGAIAMLALSGACLQAQGLKAGAAKAVITPDVHASKVYMAGFDYNRVATGVHDDLYVRCLALGVPHTTLAICEADLIGLFYDDVLKVRKEVRTAAPEVTQVIVGSSHDHEGPDTLGLWGPSALQSGMDEKYMDELDHKIAGAALEAVHSMQDARLTLGEDNNPLLALLQDDSRPPYVKDPRLLVMRLVAEDSGSPIATLINWSDHPETLGGANTRITADYPHWLCQHVESHLGGIAVFFNGSIGGLLSTLGDSVAIEDPGNGEVAKDGTWDKAELVGNMLGLLAERAVNLGKAAPVDSIVIRKAVIFAPVQNDHFRIAGAMGVFKGRKGLYTSRKLDPAFVEKDIPGLGRLRYATGKDTESEVDYVQLLNHGGLVAEIATVPGEIYPELVNGGITRYPGADFPEAPFEPAVRAYMRSAYQFVLGLANDELGYIIPKAEWDNQPPWLRGKKTRWYGEVNSAGPEVAGVVTRTLVGLMKPP
ncbi:MAG: hypothetical protein ACRD3T_11560 [Terriglobia bacterium]